MCGIAGALNFNDTAGPVDQAIVSSLNDLQRRRGPDGAGLWSSNDNRVVFGHRRLAIIDTSESGAQPMSDVSGRWTITFNGEIYNYRELRLELERSGRVFRTNCDTEVLINAVAQWGEQALRRLRGMFAFALWDGQQQELWLARDPYGIKPLYAATSRDTIWFASQARALARCAPVDTRYDAAALTGFYLWGYVPEPFSWWTGIRMFPAGHVQRIRLGERPSTPVPFALIQDEYIKQHDQSLAPGELHQLLLETVRDHLVSDVPVGIFLSAGIDSNAIAGLAAELGAELRTITLAFDEYSGTSADEAPIAEEAARLLRSDHVTVRMSKRDFGEAIEDFLESMDQPTIDGLNTYLISRAAAKQGLKVALSGLGGDELFGGYPSFRHVPAIIKWGKRVPFPHFSSGAVRRLSNLLTHYGVPPKVPALLSHSRDLPSAYLLRRALHLEDELNAMLDGNCVKEGLERLATLGALEGTLGQHRAAETTAHAQIALLESCWYLRNQPLRDTDWSSMAHGLEVRVPFVDIRLLERLGPAIASGVPPNKRDLAASAKHLSPRVVGRCKTGFSIPIRDWVSEHLGAPERGLRGWAKFVAGQFDCSSKLSSHPAIHQLHGGKPMHQPVGTLPGAIESNRLFDESILIFRIGSIGDTVIALPCLHKIADSFPNSRRIVVTNAPVSAKAAPLSSVLGTSGLADDFIQFSPSTRNLREILQLRDKIRKTGATTLIYLSPASLFRTLRDVAFFRCCGIRRIVGAPLSRDLRNCRVDASTGMYEREAERLARCLWRLGSIDLHDRSLWDLRLQAEEIAAAKRFLSPLGGVCFLAVNTGGKVPRNDWGDEYWIELFELLSLEYSHFAIGMLGSQDERIRSERILSNWQGPKINLCGKLTPRESAAVIQQAALFVGHDSGPMHLAAAVGTPCVAMLGDFNPPKKWHPFGGEHSVIHDMRGVRHISPQQVFAAARSAIAARREREISLQCTAAEM
jgi:asparagine synthase (glutamine-hydrolysing)